MISKIDENSNIFACFITVARQWDVALCTWVRVCLHLLPRQVLNHFHKILRHNEAQKSISRSLTENPGFNHCSNVSEKVPFLSLLMPLFLLFLLFYESSLLFACSSIPLSQAQMRDTSVREGRERAYGQERNGRWKKELVWTKVYGGKDEISACELSLWTGSLKSFKHMRTSGSLPIHSGTVAGWEGAQTGPVVEGEAKIIASHTLWNQQVLKRIHRRAGRTPPADRVDFFSRLL